MLRRSYARSGLGQYDQVVVLGERDAPRLLRVQVHAVRGGRVPALRRQAVAHGHLAAPAGGFQDGVEVQWHPGFYVLGYGFEVQFRAMGRDQFLEHRQELSALRDLAHHKACQMIADYKVVGARYLSELAVADIEHLADYGEPMLAVIGDLAQVQECDQGLGVCSVGIRLVRMAEDDHMVVGGDLELIQGAAVRDVAHPGRDLLVSERVEAGRGDRAVGGHHHHLRAGTDVVVELGDYLRRAVVPPEDQGAFGPGLPGWRFSYGPGVDLICLMFRGMYRAVVFGDQYSLVVRGDPAASLRVQHDATILLAQSDHRATLVCCEGFVEGHVDETGLAEKVDR